MGRVEVGGQTLEYLSNVVSQEICIGTYYPV